MRAIQLLQTLFTITKIFDGACSSVQNKKNRGKIISYELKFDYTIAEAREEINNNIPIGIPEFLINLIVYVNYDMKGYKIIYETIDYEGNIAYASGMVILPQQSCAAALAVYCHGTVFDKESVPSNERGAGGGKEEFVIGIALAGAGYMTVMPDYLGLGPESENFHPYVDATTGASGTIDIMRASRELCAKLNYNLNSQVFISGYSQGGHVGMATIREVSRHYSSEFNIDFAGLGSGPYDLSETQYRFIFDNPFYEMPQYILYVAASCQETLKNLYDSPSEALLSPFDELYESDILGQTGDYSWVPSNWTEMFIPGYIDMVEMDPNHPLRQCLRENDVYDWLNYVPTTMYYCPTDQSVDAQNAIIARDQLRDNIPWNQFWLRFNINALDCGNFSHEECAIPSLLFARTSFNIFRNSCSSKKKKKKKGKKKKRKAKKRNQNNHFTLAEDVGIKVSQISHYEITIMAKKFNHQITSVIVYDILGSEVTSVNGITSKKINVNVNHLETGFYAIQIIDDEGETYWSTSQVIKPEIIDTSSFDPISPNPMTLQSDLDLSEIPDRDLKVVLRDAKGSIQFKYSFKKKGIHTLNRGKFLAGDYILEIQAKATSYFIPLKMSNRLRESDLKTDVHTLQNILKFDLNLIEERIEKVELLDEHKILLEELKVDEENQTVVIDSDKYSSGKYLLWIKTVYQKYEMGLSI